MVSSPWRLGVSRLWRRIYTKPNPNPEHCGVGREWGIIGYYCWVSACYFLRGNLAEIQLAWEQMEDYDPTLSTCLHARQYALAEMSWRIEPDQTLLTENSTLAPLAAAQAKLLATRLRAVENLEDSLVHLGTADFRGVAALEITGSPDRQKWCVIEPWHLLRPVRRGPWFFNPDAATTCPNPETLLQDRVIIRESRPIDLAAMFLVLAKTHALQGWDGFLDIYGLPSRMPLSRNTRG